MFLFLSWALLTALFNSDTPIREGVSHVIWDRSSDLLSFALEPSRREVVLQWLLSQFDSTIKPIMVTDYSGGTVAESHRFFPWISSLVISLLMSSCQLKHIQYYLAYWNTCSFPLPRTKGTISRVIHSDFRVGNINTSSSSGVCSSSISLLASLLS